MLGWLFCTACIAVSHACGDPAHAVQEHGNVRELVTPPLDGTILPGVTRDSILQLTRQWGKFEVSERQLSIKELKQVCLLGPILR